MLPRYLISTAIPLLLWSCAAASVSPSQGNLSTPQSPTRSALPLATVVSTGDGDTLRVKFVSATKPTTIRLACVDAPEKSQPEGVASADRLRQLLPKGTAVQVREVDTDRYGRTVAELYVSSNSINVQMVADGQAIVYSRYLSGCPESQFNLLNAEQSAQQSHLGVWGSAGFVKPWEWRHSH